MNQKRNTFDIVLHFLVAMRTPDEGERAWLYINWNLDAVKPANNQTLRAVARGRAGRHTLEGR